MSDWLEDVRLNTKLPLVVGIVAAMLVLMPAVNVVAVLFGGGNEVSYDYGVYGTSCGIPQAGCVTFTELTIGNTGASSQQLIEIDFSDLPPWQNVSHGAVKIVASNDEWVYPNIRIDVERRQIAIDNLDENLMVEFHLTYYGPEANQTLEHATPAIHATGRVIASNPKATAFARAIRTAFAFLI